MISSRSRYVLPGCPKFSAQLWLLVNFDLGHSFLLASSASGSARKRPHFDTPPCITIHFLGECYMISSQPRT